MANLQPDLPTTYLMPLHCGKLMEAAAGSISNVVMERRGNSSSPFTGLTPPSEPPHLNSGFN